MRKEMIDLTPALLKRHYHDPPKFGRYNASELWGIVNGYADPKTWLLGHPVKPQDALRMWSGRWKHEQVQELLVGWIREEKRESEYRDIVLVGKVDAMNETTILEIKTSDAVMTEAKKWAEYQAKIYCSMFERPKAYVVQPVIKGTKIILKELGHVNRNDKWFQNQLSKLYEFHELVCTSKENPSS